MKKLSLFLAFNLLTTLGSYLFISKFRAGVHFVLWHYGMISPPNFSSALETVPDHIGGLEMNTPSEETKNQLIHILDTINHYEKYSAELEKRVKSKYIQFGIEKKSRIVANEKKDSITRILEQMKESKSGSKFSTQIGIGVDPSKFQQISLQQFKDKTKLAEIFQIYGMIDLGKSYQVPLGIYALPEPKELILGNLDKVELSEDIKTKIQLVLDQVEVKVSYETGLPSYEIKYENPFGLKFFVTLLSSRYLVWSTDQTKFKAFTESLIQQRISFRSHAHNSSDFFRGHISVHNIYKHLPETFRIMAPSELEKMKTLAFSLNLNSKVQAMATLNFDDNQSAKKIFAQLNLLKSIVPLDKLNKDSLDESLNSKIKFVNNENKIALNVQLEYSEIKNTALEEIKTKTKTLIADYQALEAVQKYMTLHKLSKIDLSRHTKKADDRANLFQFQNETITEEINYLSDSQIQNFRPIAFVTKMNCKESARVEIKMAKTGHSEFEKFFPMFLNRLEAKEEWDFGKESSEIKVLFLANVSAMDSIELTYKPLVAVNPANYGLRKKSRDLSSSGCILDFEPFLIGQRK